MRLLQLHAAILVCSVTFAVENPHLRRARGEIEQLRFESARASLEAALRTGTNTPETLIEIARRSAEVAVAIGDIEQAEHFFRMWILLAPTADLPDGVSPKIRAGFEGAQKWLEEHGRLRVRHDVWKAQTSKLALVVESDPMGLVAGARAFCHLTNKSVRVVEARGTGRIEVPLPAAGQMQIVLAAIDQYGNRLIEMGREAPIAIDIPRTGQDDDDPYAEGSSGPPIYTRWWVWGSVAGITGLVTILYGLKARSAASDLEDLNSESEMHDFSEAQALEDRGRSATTIANVSLVLTGVFGAVAGYFAYRDWKASNSKPAPSSKQSVGVLYSW